MDKLFYICLFYHNNIATHNMLSDCILDPETPRPTNYNDNICSEGEEIRHSSHNTKETRLEMNDLIRNDVSSTVPEDKKYIPPFRHVPVCHTNEVMENTNKDTSFKSKTKDYYGCTCNFDNANPTNQEETKFKEISEQTGGRVLLL